MPETEPVNRGPANVFDPADREVFIRFGPRVLKSHREAARIVEEGLERLRDHQPHDIDATVVRVGPQG